MIMRFVNTTSFDVIFTFSLTYIEVLTYLFLYYLILQSHYLYFSFILLGLIRDLPSIKIMMVIYYNNKEVFSISRSE